MSVWQRLWREETLVLVAALRQTPHHENARCPKAVHTTKTGRDLPSHGRKKLLAVCQLHFSRTFALELMIQKEAMDYATVLLAIQKSGEPRLNKEAPSNLGRDWARAIHSFAWGNVNRPEAREANLAGALHTAPGQGLPLSATFPSKLVLDFN